jgi:signal-transduction protein with cAMP-binding, CBS, and nucleotidyltransferase domain
MVLVVKDIVEKDFLSLPRTMTALEAAQRMKASKHGFVIVVSLEGNPEGIVTEWDYLEKVVAEAKDPAKVKLEELMSAELVSVKPTDGLEYVAQLMSEKGIRRVLVVQQGKVLGVVTSKTMLARMKDYVDRVSSQIARLQAPQL